MSTSKALVAKEKGNQAFKSGDFPAAIGHYTSAILADKSDPTFYLNRAAAYLKLGKYEDAERDCTSVLTLSKNNVKALFRRGQARVGLDRPLEAQQDFSEVLRIEPSNKAAQDELSSVSTLIQKEKAKKAKSPISPVQSSLSPQSTQGKRRRVPIRVVGADGKPLAASAPAAAPSGATKNAGASSPEPKTMEDPMDVDTEPPAPAPSKAQPSPAPHSKPKASSLEAVSSRPLKSTSPSAPPAPPSSKPSAPSAPSPASPPSAPAPAPSPPPPPSAPPAPTSKPAAAGFKEAKEARQTRANASVAVGGGIFKKNGESVLFKTRGGAPAADEGAEGEAMDVDEPEASKKAQTQTAAAAPAAVRTQPMADLDLNLNLEPKLNGSGSGSGTGNENGVLPTKPKPPVEKAPTTLFEFVRLWDRLGSVEERWGLINMIPPNEFPALVKLSLEPAQLVSLFETFLAVLQSSPPTQSGRADLKGRIEAYLDAFTRIPRFATLLLFLSKKEKEAVKNVLALVGVGAAGVWKGVA